jgi:hypothetical protein
VLTAVAVVGLGVLPGTVVEWAAGGVAAAAKVAGL